MAEKKATKAAATKAAAPKKETAKKAAAPKKAAAKKAEVVINAENVGFKAGDVYNALAAAEKALTVAEIAKSAKISAEEAFLGIGWLLKEGKVKDDNNKIALA
jgi:membrane protein involved in colicin uptake